MHARIGLILCAVSFLTPVQAFPPIVDAAQGLDLFPASATTTASDAQGGFYIGGRRPGPADVFPEADRIGPLSGEDILIVRYDTTTSQRTSALLIGGSQNDAINALSSDSAGNLFVLGTTYSSDFPGAPTPIPGAQSFFVMKVSAATRKPEFTLALGNTLRAEHLGIDANGSVYVAGVALPRDLAPTHSFDGDPEKLYPFFAKWNPASKAFEWARYFPNLEDGIQSFAIDANGRVLVQRRQTLEIYDGAANLIKSIAVTGSFMLRTDPAGNIYVSNMVDGYTTVHKFTSAGENVFSRKIAAISGSRLAVARDGRILVLFDFANSAFPTKNATQPCSQNAAAIMVLSPTGELLHSTFSSPFLALPVAIGNYIYAIYNTGIARINTNSLPPDRLSPACLTHGATYEPANLSPGLISTIFGGNLGPKEGIAGQPAADRYPSTLAEVSVTVGGRPAPLLFVREDQINFIVPFSLPTWTGTSVCVRRGEEVCIPAVVAPASPGVFPFGDGFAILNQDFTVNSQSNPAAQGSAIAVYLTGAPPHNPNAADGTVATADLQYTPGAITAELVDTRRGCSLFGGCPWTYYPSRVLYAGTAPGLVLGAQQVNVLIPTQPALAAPVPARLSLEIRFDGYAAHAQVWVK